jgi:hypothetical protein
MRHDLGRVQDPAEELALLVEQLLEDGIAAILPTSLTLGIAKPLANKLASRHPGEGRDPLVSP